MLPHKYNCSLEGFGGLPRPANSNIIIFSGDYRKSGFCFKTDNFGENNVDGIRYWYTNKNRLKPKKRFFDRNISRFQTSVRGFPVQLSYRISVANVGGGNKKKLVISTHPSGNNITHAVFFRLGGKFLSNFYRVDGHGRVRTVAGLTPVGREPGRNPARVFKLSPAD